METLRIQDAFLFWRLEDSDEPAVRYLLRQRDTLAFISRGIIRCQVCHELIEQGERGLRIITPYSESGFAVCSLHARECVPVIEMIFWLEGGHTAYFANHFAPPGHDGMQATTYDEAVMFAEHAIHKLPTWETCKIHCGIDIWMCERGDDSDAMIFHPVR